VLWRESLKKHRVRHCGRFATGDTVQVKVTRSAEGSVAGLGGVQTCGSVWDCPVCSEKINAGRQAELSAGIAGWLRGGKAVLFGTLTVQHRDGMGLAKLWDAISPAWNRVTSGAGVAWNGGKYTLGDKAQYGIRGYVRVVETTHGKNGWHPHVHFLLFLDEELSEVDRTDLEQKMFARWAKALGKAGYRTGRKHGIDLRPVYAGDALGDYFTKGTYTTSGGAAYEVTGSHAKRSGAGRTPFQLLESVVTTGDADDLDLWHEWQAASKGRRQLVWSRGLRALLALGVEKTDEELAAEDNGGEDVIQLDKAAYRVIAAAGLVPDLLECVETDESGWKLHQLLAGWGFHPLTQYSLRYG